MFSFHKLEYFQIVFDHNSIACDNLLSDEACAALFKGAGNDRPVVANINMPRPLSCYGLVSNFSYRNVCEI